ncbi:MAG: hypothetical protein M3082_14250 [Candidatus Dormibacteraeota bacterium]|nr:hypothetical protein [Candidatus Dormibacteraeota bacterium]
MVSKKEIHEAILRYLRDVDWHEAELVIGNQLIEFDGDPLDCAEPPAEA